MKNLLYPVAYPNGIGYSHAMTVRNNTEGAEMKVRTVKTTSGPVRTADNPLNAWVRSLDDGRFYRTVRP